MKEGAPVELVRSLAKVDVAGADDECCTRVLQGLSRLIAWAESNKLAVAKRLAADRTLTITLPDGTMSCHSPPKALAA